MALRRCMQHSLLLRHTSLQLQHINQSEICIQQLLLPQGRLFSSSSSSKPDSADAPQQPPPSSPAEPQQQQPAAAGKAAGSNAATVTTTAAATRPKVEEEWTEVVDEKSGQTYYWNQKTGETTDLGEPRPRTRFRDADWEQAASSSTGPFQDGWREPPGRDHTYFYSVVGVGVGIVVGWFTQYLH